MENIKLYINASIDDVKIYIDKLIDVINKSNSKFGEFWNKSIDDNKNNNYWNLIYNKLNVYLNTIIDNKLIGIISSNNINTILFLLFGIINDINTNNKSNIKLELYENSMYSNEINNFRNCVIIQF